MSTIVNKKLQIAIADDHPIVVNVLKYQLSHLPEAEIVLVAETGDALLEMLRSISCAVIITDFAMPASDSKDKTDGFSLIKRLHADFPSIKLIVYTAINYIVVIKRLYRMGVFAVIRKKEQSEELLNACRAAQANERVYFPAALRAELDLNKARQDLEDKELTLSELEVVRLFVKGNSLSEICAYLARTPSTVSTHKNNALRKLGLATNADLIKYAYATGLV